MMNPKDRSFVIVGASFAGAVAAATLREEGFDGRVFLAGAEPHVPYERPPLSKTYLRGETPEEQTYVHPEGFYEENGIELMTSTTVSEIEAGASEVALEGGGRLRFDRLLIATGAEPRRLDMPGGDLGGVYYLRDLEDSDAIAERLVQGARVVIIGSGWIGSEVAASARQKGVEATVIQQEEFPLVRQLGPEIGRVYRDLHEDRGVEFVTAPGVAAFEGDGAVSRVRTSDSRTIEADFVVVATGVAPRTGLAERAGIAVDNGILTDEFLRTSAPSVFAAGDVANTRNAFYDRSLRVEHWDNARAQGERGYPVFASTPGSRAGMETAGVPVAGTLDDLLPRVDVVVDCTPKGIAAQNKERYEAAGVKGIFQGGEEHELAGYSFVAQANYEGALGRDFARVVSCNTTALTRISHALHRREWVERVRAVLLRRGTDPWESHATGMINTAIPETKVPSHQGPDAQSVIPDLDITTLAGAGPYNLSHLHYAMIETTRPVGPDELRDALWDEPRVAFVRAGDGLVALNSVMELMRDLDRPRGDMWEVAVWEDALAADEREVYLTFQVHNEAIIVPENVDCVRALTKLETDGPASIEKTDAAMGLARAFLPATTRPIEHLSGDEVEHPAVEAVRATRARYRAAGFKGSEEPTGEPAGSVSFAPWPGPGDSEGGGSD